MQKFNVMRGIIAVQLNITPIAKQAMGEMAPKVRACACARSCSQPRSRVACGVWRVACVACSKLEGVLRTHSHT